MFFQNDIIYVPFKIQTTLGQIYINNTINNNNILIVFQTVIKLSYGTSGFRGTPFKKHSPSKSIYMSYEHYEIVSSFTCCTWK
jgi:hypothetical protein